MKCSLGQPLTPHVDSKGFMYVQWSMLATLPKKAAASSTWSYAQSSVRRPALSGHGSDPKRSSNSILLTGLFPVQAVPHRSLL